MAVGQGVEKISRRLRRLRRHSVVGLMICLVCSVGGRSLHAAGGVAGSSAVEAAFSEMFRSPEDLFQTHDHMIAYFQSHESAREASLSYAGETVSKFPKKKKATEGDGEIFIRALELVSYIIDPRAEDILLSDPAFHTGWIVLRGVARQDPTTVVPKLIALFDHGSRTEKNHGDRRSVVLAYMTMFENGRLSAETPHYRTIRSQILLFGESRNAGDRYDAASALSRMPRDPEVTAALERLAKDPADHVRKNAVAAIAERAERSEGGAPPPMQ